MQSRWKPSDQAIILGILKICQIKYCLVIGNLNLAFLPLFPTMALITCLKLQNMMQVPLSSWAFRSCWACGVLIFLNSLKWLNLLFVRHFRCFWTSRDDRNSFNTFKYKALNFEKHSKFLWGTLGVFALVLAVIIGVAVWCKSKKAKVDEKEEWWDYNYYNFKLFVKWNH